MSSLSSEYIVPLTGSAKMKRKTSQSLFLVVYLGNKPLNENNSNAVIPWVIEELRLKKKGESSHCWFTPGPDHFALVKENGEEHLKCAHRDVVRCCTGHGDGPSFAVVVREEKLERGTAAALGNVQCVCHAFEAASRQDASGLVQKLRAHVSFLRTPESARKFRQLLSSSPISKSPSAEEGLNRVSDGSSSAYQLSESFKKDTPMSPLLTLHSAGLAAQAAEFSVCYAGSVRVPSLQMDSRAVDSLLEKLRQTQQNRQESLGEEGGGEKVDGGEKSKGCTSPLGSMRASLLVNKSYSSMDALADSSRTTVVDKGVLDLVEDGGGSGGDSYACYSLAGEEQRGKEEAEESYSVETERLEDNSSDDGISNPASQLLPSISVTPNSPTCCSAPGDLLLTQQDELVLSVAPSTVSGDELSALDRVCYQSVHLGISTQRVCVTLPVCGKVVLEKKVTSIAFCLQGRNHGNHFGFVTKEMVGNGKERPCYCHIFKAESKAKANSVLKSFQATFVQALKKTLPHSLCPSCPLLQLHILCKDLGAQGMTVAQQQARVQEALSTLSDKDYNSLMKQFKTQSIASTDQEGLVDLVTLYRQHLEAQQANHTHTANEDGAAGLGEIKLEEKGKLKSLSRLERARQSLASSLESIRSKVQRRNSGRTPEGRGLQRQEAVSPAATVVPSKVHSDNTSTQPSAGLSTTTTPVRDRSSSVPVGASNAMLSAKRQPLERRMTTGSGSSRPVDANGCVKSMGLPSFSSLETSTGQIPRQNAVGSLSSSMQSSSTVNSSFSEPSSPVVQTPPNLRHRRQLSLSPPTTSGKRLSGVELPGYSDSITPVKQRAWRQIVFESVTPQRGMDRDTSIQEFTAIGKPEPVASLPLQSVGECDSPQTRARKRWRVLVEQQIMLNRIEKLNLNYLLESQQAEKKRKKLSYYDPTIAVMEAQSRWDKLMATEVDVSQEELKLSLFRGVSPHNRGDVWSFLVKQKLSSLEGQEPVSASDGPTVPEYQEMKSGTTDYEQVIRMDLDRTFPSHPYFSTSFQDGQRGLYNVLHAYSVADEEVGYCQGMSYIAGIFLIHSREEKQAFKLLWHYMQDYGFREHYKKNMFVLQVRMYQLSAQLHEYLPTLHAHLEKHTVSSYLIAAPWFLTMFSSQYPFAFVSRVMDLVLFEGLEAFFKVSLALLTLHEDSILQCDNMESISEYIKVKMPETALDHLPYILSYTLKAPPDFCLKLKGFEAEYHVLHNLKLSSSPRKEPGCLEETVEEVRKQNSELIEQVAACRGAVTRLEAQLQSQLEREARKDRLIESLSERLEALEKRLESSKLQLV